MRKVAILILVLLLEVSLCSCEVKGEGMLRSYDQRTADKQLDAILDAIHRSDEDALIALFSENSRSVLTSSNGTIVELFLYFEGDVEGYCDWGGPYVETTKENGQVIQTYESTYDVRTTACEYRFAIRYISKNTVEPNSVGIESLYVIKKAEDIDAAYAYWGDGLSTPGINIGIPNAI